jgi:hypothetical protein
MKIFKVKAKDQVVPYNALKAGIILKEIAVIY